MTRTLSESEILQELTAVLGDSFGFSYSAPIDRQTRFFADLGLASIDAVVLAEALQRHFGRPFPFDALMADLGRRAERDLTIGELVDFLRHHLSPGDRL
jgi:acyl carrier protein